jgi:hypothetical protein
MPEQMPAVQLAIKHGWIVFSRGTHSICLSEKGCRLTRTL